MNAVTKMIVILVIVAIVATTGGYFVNQRQNKNKMVSSFGQYQGYSVAVYDGNIRRSDYLTLANGTRLAYDLILPTRKGVVASEPLPVLFKYTPYLRTFTIFDENGNDKISDLFALGWFEKVFLRVRLILSPERGRLMDPVFRTKWLETMLNHGYAVIVVERPGTGASFGKLDMSVSASAREADEILDWIAAQEWCDGNIGMYGDSWQAQVQLAAASTGNPHLKAIFPVSTWIDTYGSVMYPGGVFNKAFASFFTWSTSFLERVVTPVDSDKDGALMAQAIEERSGTTLGQSADKWYRQFPYHDSRTSKGMDFWKEGSAIYPLIEQINRSGVAVYMTDGWYDIVTKDVLVLYANLSVPKKLMVRPTDHSQGEEKQYDLDNGVEALRWFDYWLKGIDNGIMDEPPVHYYMIGATKAVAWQTSEQWPPANLTGTRYYLSEGKSGSVASANDGLLLTQNPSDKTAADAYMVDYSTTTGKKSRWVAVDWARDYPDMRTNDQKALTYTTPALENALDVAGHPIVHLWLTTAAPDLDVYVYLEEVDASGKSTYITEGTLRATHRAQSVAPYYNLGLPYQSHDENDLQAVPAGAPIELVFDLLPTAYHFQQGCRVRLTIAFADADNFDTPVLTPAPNVQILRTIDHQSYVELPVKN
jgi:putative CocE/NonD family hydrolase